MVWLICGSKTLGDEFKQHCHSKNVVRGSCFSSNKSGDNMTLQNWGRFKSIKRVGYTTVKIMDWRVCDKKCQHVHVCGPKIIENYQDFFSFHRPCSVHLILFINVDLLMNTSILTWDTIDTSEICSTFVKTQQIKPHSFMHYFNNFF